MIVLLTPFRHSDLCQWRRWWWLYSNCLPGLLSPLVEHKRHRALSYVRALGMRALTIRMAMMMMILVKFKMILMIYYDRYMIMMKMAIRARWWDIKALVATGARIWESCYLEKRPPSWELHLFLIVLVIIIIIIMVMKRDGWRYQNRWIFGEVPKGGEY